MDLVIGGVEDISRKALESALDIAKAANSSLLSIQGSGLNTATAEQRYFTALTAYNTADPLQKGEVGKTLLEASQLMFASGTRYQSDYQRVIQDLTALSGATADTPAMQQVTLLEQISSALTDNDSPLLRLLAPRTTGQLGSALEGYTGFAIGTPYVPYDQLANIHQGEIIIDRQSSDVLRKYGIPATGSADNKETLAELKQQNKLLADQNSLLMALLKTTQAGFTESIQVSKSQDRRLQTVEQKTRSAVNE